MCSALNFNWMKRKNKFNSTFTKLKLKRNFQTIHTLIERYSKGWYLRYIVTLALACFFSRVFRVLETVPDPQTCFEPDVSYCKELCRVAAQDQHGQQFFYVFLSTDL